MRVAGRSTPSLTSSSMLWAPVSSARRMFGNAPARVRPGEEPPTYQWTQAPRETSAMLVISSMIVIPLWMLVMWEDKMQRKKRATMAWAEAYETSSDPWKRREAPKEDRPTGYAN